VVVLEDGAVHLYEMNSGQETHSFNLKNGGRVLFSPSGKSLVGITDNQDLIVWDTSTGKKLGSLSGLDWVHGVTFTPQEDVLAVIDGAGLLQLWDLAAWKRLASLGGYGENAHPLQFSPGGRLLAGGSEDGYIYLWGAP